MNYTDDLIYSFAKRFVSEYQGDLPVFVNKNNFSTGEYLSETENYINISQSPTARGVISSVGDFVLRDLGINIELNYSKDKPFMKKKRYIEKIFKNELRIKIYSLETEPASETSRCFYVFPKDVPTSNPILIDQNQEIWSWTIGATNF